MHWGLLRPVGRRSALLLLLLLSALMLIGAACGDDDKDTIAAPPAGAAAAADATAYPFTFTDDTGQSLTLAARPERIVAILPSITNYLLDLGAGGRIVAADAFSLEDYAAGPDAPLANAADVGGDGLTFNVEAIVAAEPDLVLSAGGFSGGELTAQLRALGLTVAEIQFPGAVEEMLADIRLVGEIVDRKAEAATLVESLQARLDAIAQRTAGAPPLRVYMELDQSDPTQPYSVGPGSLHDEMITRAGGTNIFHDAASAFPQVNFEAIITRNPEVVVLTNAAEESDPLELNTISLEQVAQRTGWNTTAAVQARTIYAVSPDLFSTTGEKLITAMEQLAAIIAVARDQLKP